MTEPIRAGMDKAPQEVAAMFDDVAQRYDMTNTVLSMGQDRLWRKAVLAGVDPRDGERILDLAAGTGASTQSLAASGAHVIACDFSLGMLRAGRAARPELNFVAGDATALPFADHSFDAVISLNTIHNFSREGVVKALRELQRVSKGRGFVQVDSYYTSEQKAIFEDWVLTAEYHDFPDEWIKLFKQAGYTGDYFWTILE